MIQKFKSHRHLFLISVAVLLASCVTTTPSRNNQPIPKQDDSNVLKALAKSDFDHLADVEMRENTQSLRTLMIKLYKRNPHEIKKSSAKNVDERVKSIFENKKNWMFDEINQVQGVEAIQQAFRPDYSGDRVLSFIIGLQSMLIKAHGGKSEFYYIDNINPQNIYNAARNVELAVWMLSNKRDSNGQLFLLTNELNSDDRNLSFEREFGKIIGSLDLYAIATSEKSQRGLVHIVQNLATALFLPFSH